MERLTLSVVIPTRDRAQLIRDVLEALLDDPAVSEVVVVDDGSTDETPAVLEAAARETEELRVIRADGVGAAAARQLGVESATGAVVLLLDDDVVPSSRLASGHLARHEAARREAGPAALVVVGYMPTRSPRRSTRGTFASRLYAAEYQAHVDRWIRGELDVLTTLWAGNLSLPRWLCLEVGIVSGDFPPTNHQDRDFGLRLAKSGATAVFDPSLRAVHAHDRPLDAFLRDSFRQGVGRWHLHRLHRDQLGEPAGTLPSRPPVRWIVSACDQALVRRPVLWALRSGIRASGAAGRAGLEERLAKVARLIVLRDGFRSAAATEVAGAHPGPTSATERDGGGGSKPR
jgi:GT2 family glycosyltransferase